VWLVTIDNERHTFYFRLKDLEARAVLANGQELAISRIHARSVRDRLLTL
jgi:hypothetical protein